MGLKLNIAVDDTGAPRPNSHWELVGFSMDLANRSAVFNFLGWHDAESKASSKGNFSSHDFYLSGADYDALETAIHADLIDLAEIFAIAAPDLFFSEAERVAAA